MTQARCFFLLLNSECILKKDVRDKGAELQSVCTPSPPTQLFSFPNWPRAHDRRFSRLQSEA